ACGMDVRVEPVTHDQLLTATEVFAANSVRGVIPVLGLADGSGEWPVGQAARTFTGMLARAASVPSPSLDPSGPGRMARDSMPSLSLARPGILLIDNYDSFTYNLAHLILACGVAVEVVRNDEVTADQIADLDPDGVLLSPGPCAPLEAGVCVSAVQRLDGRTPILGVCLGHQVIAAAYGADITRTAPVHGRTSIIRHNGQGTLRGLPERFDATRYHSLLVDEATLPPSLRVTARSSDGLVMALRHT